jgi:hypothetical protein|tara:strand:+ start:243 stop:440 length:198 start_codon:yes stop_codon:yes gene_type:complete
MKYEVVIRLGFEKRPRRKDINNKLFDHMRDNDLKYKINKEKKLELVSIKKGERDGIRRISKKTIY